MTDDPRKLQVLALSTLLVAGVTYFDFSLQPVVLVATVATALVTQCLITRQSQDLWSAAISSLSLCLLLRTSSVTLAVLAAFVAIASKRVLRRDGRHFFNPTAFALVIVTSTTTGAWVSVGQWGHTAALMILVTAIGLFVTTRAARGDISLVFLGVYTLLVSLRAAILGDPFAIVWHQLNSGALLVFAFFMLSDPKTIPENPLARCLFGGVVALGAAYIEFVIYRANGPLFALVVAAPLVPVLNHLWPGDRYRWPQALKSAAHHQSTAGVSHG